WVNALWTDSSRYAWAELPLAAADPSCQNRHHAYQGGAVPTRRTSPVCTGLVTSSPSGTGRRDRSCGTGRRERNGSRGRRDSNDTKGRPHPAAHHPTNNSTTRLHHARL